MKPDQSRDEARAQRPFRPSRRHFLRGVGVSMAMPAFESLLPRVSAAAGGGGAAALPATTPSGAPLRMAFVYVPNGVNQSSWWPKKEGKEFELNRSMQPLERVKGQIQVISGLDQQNAFGGKDGPGDHARACATFLTGVRVKKTAGSDIHAGVSVDQLVAREVGHMTRVPLAGAGLRRRAQVG